MNLFVDFYSNYPIPSIVGICLVVVLCSWAPLKKLWRLYVLSKSKQDIVGRQLPVTHQISRTEGRVSYEGKEWQARLDEASHKTIPFGARATVVAIQGSSLIVKPLGNNLYKT